MVPVSSRLVNLPCTIRGKSVAMRPFTVLACSVAPALAGSSRSILPLTVSNSMGVVPAVCPRRALIVPFTVFASAQPDVLIRIFPFTVCAVTSLARDSASTSPFTDLPTNFTPAGTRTVNSTRTSLLLVFMRPLEPGAHSLARPQSLEGYIAQIVTPSAWGTTCTVTERKSLCRENLLASTATSVPEDFSARIDPFTPLISIVLPGVSCPCQEKSFGSTEGAAAPSASAPVRIARIVRIPLISHPRFHLRYRARCDHPHLADIAARIMVRFRRDRYPYVRLAIVPGKIPRQHPDHTIRLSLQRDHPADDRCGCPELSLPKFVAENHYMPVGILDTLKQTP